MEVGGHEIDDPSTYAFDGRRGDLALGRLATKEGIVTGTELVPVDVDDRAGREVLWDAGER